MKEKSAHRLPASRSPHWQVTECPCGQLALRLGMVRLEFTPQQFAQLHRLIEEAMDRFQVPASSERVVLGKPITH